MKKEEHGFTLIELLVVITIIAILAAVVSASVGGFITSANERTRAAQFAAVQTAIDTFASTHLDASGDLTLATYPYSTTATTNGATSCCVQFFYADAPAAGAAPFERTALKWYGADGRFCGDTGASCSAQPGFTSPGYYVYVDLYTGADTDLATLGYIRLSTGSAPGTVATRTAGVPGNGGNATGSATAFRCLFQSSESDAVAYSTSFASAKSAARTNKGKLYACRDADPAGT